MQLPDQRSVFRAHDLPDKKRSLFTASVSVAILTLLLSLSSAEVSSASENIQDHRQKVEQATPSPEATPLPEEELGTDTVLTHYPATETLENTFPGFKDLLEQLPAAIYGKHVEAFLVFPEDSIFPSLRFDASDGIRIPNSIDLSTGKIEENDTTMLEISDLAWATWITNEPAYKEYIKQYPSTRIADLQVIVEELREHVDDGVLQKAEFEFRVQVTYEQNELEETQVIAVVTVTMVPNEHGTKLEITTYDVELSTPLTAQATQVAEATLAAQATANADATKAALPTPTGTPTPRGIKVPVLIPRQTQTVTTTVTETQTATATSTPTATHEGSPTPLGTPTGTGTPTRTPVPADDGKEQTPT